MLKATYLGHQGWLFSSGDDSIIVDPLFGTEFGRGPSGARFPNWPPRRFELENMPPLRGILITHEHEDHFHIPSLNKLSRDIPIYLSALSSVAARSLLHQMGFQVRPLAPGKNLIHGDICFAPFVSDHVAQSDLDEWDTIAYAVLDSREGGSFFTPVDVTLTEQMVQSVLALNQRVVGKQTPFLVCRGDGHLFWNELSLSSYRSERHGEHLENPGELLTALRAGILPIPIPGQTFTLAANGITGIEPRTDFLVASPKSSWPAPPRWAFEASDQYFSSSTGGMALSESDWNRLEGVLARWAEFLYGRGVFQRICSWAPPEDDAPKPTFGLVLRLPDQPPRIYAYELVSCSFVRVQTEAPREAFAAGLECWAKDLLELADGIIEPRVMALGRYRYWVGAPFEGGELPDSLTVFFHPLRHPERCLSRYRDVLSAEPHVQKRIGGPAAARSQVASARQSST